MNENSTKVKRNYKKKVNEHSITYANYEEHNIDLTKYKISDLKTAIRQLGNIHLTGTKPVLIERLISRFGEIKHATLIQKIFRGWYLRLIQTLRGPALKNHKLCTNDSDMATLEPICEIATSYFFSYKDNAGFVYGFDVSSLIQHINTNRKFINPYTRENVCNIIKKNVYRVYRGSYAIFEEFRENNKKLELPRRRQLMHINRLSEIQRRMASMQNRIDANSVSSAFNQIRARVTRIRSQLSVEERTRALFVEIDQLGNYTRYSWFNNLSHRDLVLFYRALHDIWYYRAGLSHTTKRNICYGCSHNSTTPFTRHSSLGFREISFLEYDELKLTGLEIFENLVYCGVDNDHKKIGTLHALSALTLVSRDARQAMPWLYESVI